MKCFFQGPLNENARNLLRRLGYGELRARSGQISYVKRVAIGWFPRFHAYVEDQNGGVQINLHIDQKEASYEGSHAHSGEYEGKLVEEEMARIKNFVSSIKTQPVTHQRTSNVDKSKGFWGKLFG